MARYSQLLVEYYGHEVYSISSKLRLFEESDNSKILHVRLMQKTPIESLVALDGEVSLHQYHGYILEMCERIVRIKRYGLIPDKRFYLDFPDEHNRQKMSSELIALSANDDPRLYLESTFGDHKQFKNENHDGADILVQELFSDLQLGRLKVGQPVSKQLAQYLHRLWVPQKNRLDFLNVAKQLILGK